MSEINKIKLPNGTILDIADKKLALTKASGGVSGKMFELIVTERADDTKQAAKTRNFASELSLYLKEGLDNTAQFCIGDNSYLGELILANGSGFTDIFNTGSGNIGIGLPSSSGILALTTDIPTVNNSTITLTQGGVTKGSFTLNQSSAQTIALDAGGGSSNIEIITLNYSNFTYSLPSGTTFTSLRTSVLNGKHIVLRVQTDDVVDKWEYYNLSFIAGNNIQEAEQQGLYFYSQQYNYLYELRVNSDNTITANYYPIGGGSADPGYTFITLEEAEEWGIPNTWYNDDTYIYAFLDRNNNNKHYYILEIPSTIGFVEYHNVTVFLDNSLNTRINKQTDYLLIINHSNTDFDVMMDSQNPSQQFNALVSPKSLPIIPKYDSTNYVTHAKEISFMADSNILDYRLITWTASADLTYTEGGPM